VKLVLLGGVQGVGKSTIFEYLKSRFGDEVVFLDPGELFRQYCYKVGGKSPEEVEEIILKDLLDLAEDAVVVAHWHFAVLRPDGYIPQISFDRLKRLALSGKFDKALLVSVEASTDIIRSRRLKDSSGKKRNLVRQMIDEERRLDLEYLIEHYELLSGILGKDKVKTHYFSNFGPRIEDVELQDLVNMIWE
jgi:adenylate kinase